jgi:hypothetical protein
METEPAHQFRRRGRSLKGRTPFRPIAVTGNQPQHGHAWRVLAGRIGLILASEFERLALQAIDCHIGNHEPPTSILKNILQDYLETADDPTF